MESHLPCHNIITVRIRYHVSHRRRLASLSLVPSVTRGENDAADGGAVCLLSGSGTYTDYTWRKKQRTMEMR